MTDRARAAYFLAALVAVFVLAYVAGALLGPVLGVEASPPGQVDHPAEDHEGRP
mgnify:CR=1 FL=1